MLESISVYREICPTHGNLYFIERLPDKTLVSQEVIDGNRDFLVFDPETVTLTVLGENGIAVYDLQPLDDSMYYGTFNDWHLYEPPVLRHV